MNKANKAIYIDTFSQNSFHEVFNASIILIISKIFSEVECNVNFSSLIAIKKILNNKYPVNIVTNNVFVIKGNSPYNLMFRYVLSALLNVLYLIISPKDSILIYSYNNVFGIRLLNLVNKIVNKKILIFCHGEMECVVSKSNKGGLIALLVTKFSKNFFKNEKIKISKKIHFSFMGNKILENIKPHLSSQILSNIIILDHPYLFDEKNNNIKKNNSSYKLNIGTIGILNQSRGLELFFNFIKSLSIEVKNKLNITVIGKVTNYQNELKKMNVKILNPSETESLLDRALFESAIQELDYILFFYDKDSYKFTPSGAVLDAIKFEKPVIALKNDYFEYLFTKYGSFGYLLDNIIDMRIKTEELLSQEVKYFTNFKYIQNCLNPDTLSLEFEKELQRINYL